MASDPSVPDTAENTKTLSCDLSREHPFSLIFHGGGEGI